MKKIGHAIAAISMLSLLSARLSSQIIGGQGNGQQHPTEVKASEVGAGAYSGDVNLFTGTYNASYPLGTVSTPTGLSYTATLSYSSTFASGDNVPHTSGIPYGDGWSLDLPSISVSSEDYNKFSLLDMHRFMSELQVDGAYTPTYTLDEATEEGGLHWFSPTLNIPGVASGRLVYKYARNNSYHFALHTFERYLEAVFDGSTWEVVLDDGTRYQMAPFLVSYRTPSNQRVSELVYSGHGADCNEQVGNAALPNLALPKLEVLAWYCAKIVNRNISGAIHFKYEGFGGFDYNKIFTEQSEMWENISRAWLGSHANGIIKRKPEIAYTDIQLKEIDSGYERLVLEYGSISTQGATNLPDVGDLGPGEERMDSLYTSKVVYSCEGGQGFGGWYRYKHIRQQEDAYFMPLARNPYKKDYYPYQYEREPVTNNNNNFNHGYLESPRLSGASLDIVPGDIYEIRTKITGCQNDSPLSGSLFDINIATGNATNIDIGALDPNENDVEDYEKTTGESVFSTFNQAIKWFTHGVNNPMQGLNTSNYFVMPSLPQGYKGFQIQVGPANSDNDFSMTPDGLWPYGLGCNANTLPFTCMSYYGFMNQELCDYEKTGTCAGYLRSGDAIPSNFGIGYPWRMLTEFYSYNYWEGNFCYCDNSNTLAESAWWNEDGLGCNFQHRPTKAGANFFLDKVELVRYSKNPYMLKTAKKQIFNGGATVPGDPGAVWHTVGHHEFHYHIAGSQRYTSSLDGYSNVHYVENGFRNVVLLDSVVQLPYNPSGTGNNTPLVTSFGYKRYEYDGVVGNTYFFVLPAYSNNGIENNTPLTPKLNADYYILDTIRNPLGKETILEYLPIGGGSYYSKRFSYRLRPWETTNASSSPDFVKQAPSFAFQASMVVGSVTVNEAGGQKCWSYDYGPVLTHNDFPAMSENFSYDFQYRPMQGHARVTVHGPSTSCGGGPVTVYDHHPDKLRWGKLFSVEAYDENGALLSSDSYTYEALPAFEPGAHRADQGDGDGYSNYEEYEFFSGLAERPLLFSDHGGGIHAYNEAMNGWLAQQQLYQAVGFFTHLKENGPLPTAPQFGCPDNPGETCGCAQYDELSPSQQSQCDAFWADWYLSVQDMNNLYSPYTSDRAPKLFYESDYHELIETFDSTYLYSFFVKKTAESHTAYDPQPCTSGGGGGHMTTSVAYEYFDANVEGKSSCTGYAAIGADPDRLYWEPSWQLYKTTTTAGGYQTVEENFYLYDLVNNPAYLYGEWEEPLDGQFAMLRTLWAFKHKRDLPFQKRVTRSAPGGSNTRSTYYTYSMEWQTTNSVDTVINLIDPSVDEPCDGGGGNNGGGTTGPPVVSFDQHQASPPAPDLCEYVHQEDNERHLYCRPCLDNPNEAGNSAMGYINNYTPGGDSVQQMVAFWIDGKIFLKSVVEQVRPASGSDILDHSSGFEEPTFPTSPDTLAVRTILERDRVGLVVKEANERGVVTHYTYEVGYLVEYLDCSYDPPRLRSVYLANHVALPVTVTVGNIPYPLTTGYEYNIGDNTVKKITDPNGMELEYGYDGFGRMAEARRNGNLIQRVLYDNANGRAGYDFVGSAALNYVDAFNYVEEGSPGPGWGTKGFVDPLGRESATVNYSGGSHVNSEGIYDIHGRVRTRTKRHGGDTPVVDKPQVPIDLNFEMDTAPRDRPLKSAKYGIDLADQHVVTYSYCIASKEDVVKEFDVVGQTMAGSFLTDAFYRRTETTDEDGKRAVTFTDTGGNTAGTITGNGPEEAAGTVFRYGPFGTVTDVSNGENQAMSYTYNYMGQLREKQTPDEGTHLYAYDHSGNMIGHKDANNQIRLYAYDKPGRMTIQARDGNGVSDPMFAQGKDGMPWREDRAYGVLASALGSSRHEKEWYYEAPETALPINPDIVQYILPPKHGLGRLVHTVSCDNSGARIQMEFFSYNGDGFLERETSQFNNSGVTTGKKDIVVDIRYPEHNLQGSYKVQDVDIVGKGNYVDFQHYIAYDSWNRIDNVRIAFTDQKANGFQAVAYTYDDLLGTDTLRVLYNHDKVDGYLCKDMAVDSVRHSFDVRERLTGTTSLLYGHNLLYDDATQNGSHASHNGNINGTTASYDLYHPWVLNQPDNFYGPTAYGYKYDELNRLSEALADVSIFSPNYQPSYSGSPGVLGDASYTYDKVGNFLSVARGNAYPTGFQSWEFGTTTYAYNYVPTTNRLGSIGLGGKKPPGCEAVTTYSYSYDSNGNLTSDTKKGLASVEYGRANLPFALYVNPTCDKPGSSTGLYLYDAGDARTYKFSQEGGREYYLRDAAGHELFVFDMDNEEYTWYVYGNDRVAKIGKRPPYEPGATCRPLPACDSTMLANQQSFMQGLAYVTSPSAIAYPAKLFRIRLCDGSEPHLLAGELAGLPGNYTILQQIELYGANQQFSVWQANGLKVMGLAAILALRTTTDQFLLNGYDPCDGFECPRQQVACPDGGAQQAASIAALQALYANLQPGDVDLPTRLVRIRLCDGSEMYVLLEMLQGIQGPFTVLQQIEVTSAYMLLTVSQDGAPATKVQFASLLGFLLDPRREISIDGYEPCINGLPCEEDFPECGPEMMGGQAAAIQQLQQAFLLATPGSFDYPTHLYRIRLCGGEEFYVFQEELHLVPGNFTYLQDILVMANEHFQLTLSGGNTLPYPVVQGSMSHLLGYRREGRLHAVDNYEPCGGLSPCHPDGPGCSEEEQAAQRASMGALVLAMEGLNTTSLVFPLHLYLVRFCDGSTLYVLEDELYLIEGSYAILQDIELSGLEPGFQVLHPNGTTYNVPLLQFLSTRQERAGHVITGHGCESVTTSEEMYCTYTIDQINWQQPAYTSEAQDSLRIAFDKVVYRNCGQGSEQILLVEGDTVIPTPPTHTLGWSHRYEIGASYNAPCGPITSVYNVVISWDAPPYPGYSPFPTKKLPSSDHITCRDTVVSTETICGPPIIVWDDSTFIACDDNVPLPDPDGDGCPDATTTATDLSEISASAATSTAGNIPIPNAFHQVRFSNGERRLVLQSELGLIDDCAGEGEPLPIDSLDQVFQVKLPMGGGNVTLDNVLGLRAAGIAMEVEGPDPDGPSPGHGPLPTNPAEPPTLTFFIYDHLGNSRILYTNELRHCDPDSTKYLLEHVLDYYPFGKTLREYVFERERFQTTYHERDEETGLDYRGARFYDGEVGRFLSTDPKALDFAAWGTYVYTLDNPIRFIDPDGKAPIEGGPGDVVVLMAGANTFKTNSLGSSPVLMNKITQMDKEVSVAAFPSEYWGVDLESGAGFDEATQGAYDFVKNSYQEGGQVALYGYSWGGALVNHLADRLAGDGIQVDLLVTIDAAGGSQNDHVRRTVSENVKENLNIFQSTPEDDVMGFIKTGSHGAPNVAISPSTIVRNSDYTGYFQGEPGTNNFIQAKHGTMDELTHDRVAKEIVKAINP